MLQRPTNLEVYPATSQKHVFVTKPCELVYNPMLGQWGDVSVVYLMRCKRKDRHLPTPEAHMKPKKKAPIVRHLETDFVHFRTCREMRIMERVRESGH